MAENPDYVPAPVPATGQPELERFVAEELARIAAVLENFHARIVALEP